MKSRKFFIVFTFLFVFALQVSAQDIQFPNEIKGFEFYKKGKLKDMELKVSTKEDVEIILGEDCSEFRFCDYDENWKMTFLFLEDYWSKYKIEGDIEQRLIPSPEFIGRLWKITFKPKKSISFKDVKFPTKFEKEATQAIRSGIDILIYTDSEGLLYSIIDDDYDNRKYKGNVTDIIYRVPEKLEEDVFIVVKQQNKKFSDL